MTMEARDMEEIFAEIGVVQDEESNILGKYLQSKLINLETTANEETGRRFTSAGAIAQSIIENSVPDNLSEDSNFWVGDKRRKKALTKYLPALPQKVIEKEIPNLKKKSTEGLNQLLLTSTSITAKDRKLAKKISFSCPVCENTFSMKTEAEAEVFADRHLNHCLARSEKDTQVSDFVGSEEEDTFEESRGDTLDENDSNSIEEVNLVGDDWEEGHYLSRIEKLDRTAYDKIETSFGTTVHSVGWNALYSYQQEGCKWLYSLYLDGTGGLLADEMGLGKTAQVVTHLGSLGTLSRTIDRGTQAIFLVVCPATVLQHWLQELHRWAPFIRAGVFHAISSTGKALTALCTRDLLKVIKTLKNCKSAQGVALITTYEGLRKNREALQAVEWTAVCLDEGQKIRNPDTEVALVCKSLASYHRIILSGTPIQNSLKELWSLFDFIYPGRLGSLQVFEAEFAGPIRLGGYANASKLQYEIAIRCAATLQRIVRPFLLRRKKEDLAVIAKLPSKTEQVLFCNISEKQKAVYQQILSSSEVRNVISKRIPAFRAINTLRKLCNHPILVYHNGKILWQENDEANPFSRKKRKRAQFNRNMNADENNRFEDDIPLSDLIRRDGSQSGILWTESGKLLVLSKILPIWYKEGHKVLIFSQSISMLSIIEDMLKEMNFLYLTLDGTTPIGKRNEIICSFNDPLSRVYVMLLTTRTGGVGISLTAANRVILFDPDWNPMTDIQARERAWRLGQTRDVTIYRLITKGTIEEKIYQRQIFKLLLSNRILENSKQKNLFSKSQIEELFTLDDEVYYDQNGDATFDALPLAGKVDLNHISGTTNLQNRGKNISDMDYEKSGGENSDSNNQDKLILKALFDGDALTTVYNHDFFEPFGRKVMSQNQHFIENAAEKYVEDAVKALASSAPSYLLNSTHLDNNGVASGDMSDCRAPALSSANIIASIEEKSIFPRSAESENTDRGVSNPTCLLENLKSRLLQVFERKGALTSEQVLAHFKDLGDQYAPIFKQTLRSVAKLENGMWRKRLV